MTMAAEKDGKKSAFGSLVNWKMVGLLLYLLGILWIFLFPAVTITTGEFKPRLVYKDENALSSYFNIDVSLRKNDFQADAEKRLEHGMKTSMDNAREVFCSEIDALGFACHDHVHTRSDGSIGHSVYAVLNPRSGFSDRKDCVVLSAPLNQKTKGANQWDGMDILLAVARTVIEDEKWISRNLLLLGVDESAPATVGDGFDFWEDTGAFLKDYHSVSVSSSKVIKHAGVIRAAISLDLPLSSLGWKDVDIMTTGFNGELPNMDMVVVVSGAMTKYSSLPSSKSKSIWRHGPITSKNGFCDELFKRIRSAAPDWTKEYLYRLQSLLANAITMAFGPTGPHAQFLRYSIDAVTIHGSVVESEAYARKHWKLTKQNLANSVGSCVRTLSGLEEDLHHSIFYYYLMGSKTDALPYGPIEKRFFVSLQEFFGSIALVLAPLLFSILGVFSSFKQIPWLHGILMTLLFELYGAVTLVLVSLAHHKFGENLALLIGFTLFGAASPVMARVMHFFLSRIQIVKKQGLTELNEECMSVKASFGALVLYFVPVCAIMNFAFAVWFAAPMVLLLAWAQPFDASSYLSMAIDIFYIHITSHIMVCVLICLLLGQSPFQLMSWWIHGWNLEGLLIFPFLCLVYLPSHTMAFSVCLYTKRSSK